MIVYREQTRTVSEASFVRSLSADRREFLIEFGQLECALADQLPGADPRIALLRSIAHDAGRAFVNVSRPLPAIHCDLPATLEIRQPEGFAYYALFPEAYVAAALRFYRDAKPAKCVVVGIRSIGTSLSAAVAGALLEQGVCVDSFTVRPTGHPFHRVTKIDRPIDSSLFHLIVDEGPGLSGSSMASVADALSALGVPDEKLIFFPSWNPDPDRLSSIPARDRFRRHSIYVEAHDPFPGWTEISGGNWRNLYFSPREFPAVHPQHERRKFLSPDGSFLAKFAGLGERGRTALERARILHELGFSPQPVGLTSGFLLSCLVPGHPVRNVTPALIRRVKDYLFTRKFPSSAPVPWNTLSEMICVNLEEGLNIDASPLLAMRPAIVDAPTFELDGRMLIHEWIETPGGFLKTDAVDHADDHFFPGPQDLAWDVAATIVEFSLPERFLEGFPSSLQRRIPFYLVAYSAFRLGYCRMAEQSAPDESARFRKLASKYEAVLRSSPYLNGRRS